MGLSCCSHTHHICEVKDVSFYTTKNISTETTAWAKMKKKSKVKTGKRKNKLQLPKIHKKRRPGEQKTESNVKKTPMSTSETATAQDRSVHQF